MSVRSARYNTLSLRTPKGTTALPEERDAWRFLDAAGITSSRQQEAIITLVRDLKHARLWTKMKAIYPFVGATATTHKWNLKDPQDTDAAFRLVFNGGWTHSADGADPNGTNAYADTFISPSVTLDLNSSHRSIYLRENTDELKIDIGESNTTGINDASFVIARSSNIFYGRIHADGNTTTTNTDSRGFFISNRIVSNTQSIRKNKGTVVSSAMNASARTSKKVFISATSDPNGAAFYSSRQVAFVTVGDGLESSDSALLFDCIDRYQKFLGRAV